MIKFLQLLCFRAIINKLPILHKQIKLNDIDITQSKNDKNSHFQFNSAMKLSKITNIPSYNIAALIKEYIDNKSKNNFANIYITNPGFINFTIKNEYINKKIKLFKFEIKKIKKEKILLDYSSPNIAKNMHVGHLRSTIIGDCLAKILKYIGHDIIKINHLGDWGTQFGILIAYIKETFNNNINIKKNLNELSILYKKAQVYFETNENFKKTAKMEVVKLQNRNIKSIKIWKLINKISKKEYEKIYKMLDIKIKYQGESFYNELINPLIKKLEKKNIITLSDNAKCIYIKGFKNRDESPLPFIIKKSDGAFNYSSTDLAALYYRIKYNKVNKIIYITDVGQKMHFEMLFKALKLSGINVFQNTKLIHIPIGLMLNNNGKKIKTRSGTSEKLINLIKNSIKETQKILINKKKITNKKIIIKNSKILGINTLKYSDLSNKIDQNYIFDYKKILQFNGNTAAFLNYAYVRINGIKNKLKKEKFFLNKIVLQNNTEIILALHILQYDYIIKKTAEDLNPNILTHYLYKLSEIFHSFFHECNVIKSDNKTTRIHLCNITKKILKNGMSLLGLKIINKM